MNTQEVFEFVFEKLYNQKGASMNSYQDSCLYRGENGRRCAVGWLISDDVYQSAFEYNNISALIHGIYGKHLPKEIKENEPLLAVMQRRMHDNLSDYGSEMFRVRLIQETKHIAKEYNLSSDFIDKYWMEN